MTPHLGKISGKSSPEVPGVNGVKKSKRGKSITPHLESLTR